MKKVLNYSKYLIPAIIIITVVVIFFYESALSKDQKNTVKMLGYPSQFVITYLPRGEADNPQLVRSETWYYPKASISINFLGGNFSFEEEFISEKEMSDTPLKPQDFDFFLSYKDLEKIFGSGNITPVNFLPVLYEENQTATYITDLALFIIESDQLTYFQTTDLEKGETLIENPIEDADADADEEISKESNKDFENENDWKTYQNSNLKIKIKYPTDWYLEDDNTVLSSYDTGYMEKGLELPEKRLKCDFFIYEDSDVEIKDKEQIIDKKISVYEGQADSLSDEEGPGLGDSHMFLFREDKKDSIGLLCYTFDASFSSKLLEMFETFEFVD